MMRSMGKFRWGYAASTLLYAITGVATIAFSSVLCTEIRTDQVLKLIFVPVTLKLGLAFGTICVVSTGFGLFSMMNTEGQRAALYMYGLLTVVVTVLEMFCAAILWFETLQMRAFFDERWTTGFNPLEMATFQDEHSCCGFADPRDRAANSIFCPSANAGSSIVSGCKEIISKRGTSSLEVIYTTIFVFVVVNVVAFTCCLILGQMRQQDARFKKIEEKGQKPV